MDSSVSEEGAMGGRVPDPDKSQDRHTHRANHPLTHIQNPDLNLDDRNHSQTGCKKIKYHHWTLNKVARLRRALRTDELPIVEGLHGSCAYCTVASFSQRNKNSHKRLFPGKKKFLFILSPSPNSSHNAS